ncbi:nickel-dependent hydrogenase large subunit [Anaeromicropila herbilytica]|uniref:Ni/Fe hydrogenase n=1 Tax=Anaeromicropila herbilytica TaxID=2785025 RepID=A0A7R7IDM9_9FIRM|nr:nickel-dependent hydrogenase large subunit [Anaeromicropila herbilytica]BCN31249.1 Ni/Fe hydrogenase [Anaeromicropila herbilytica]
MAKTIIIDPITRISGFLEISVNIEDDTIVDARTSGLLYRGFETILKNRFPFDSIFITERICGICSTAHAVTAALADENALKIEVSLNDRYLRDLVHGFEIMQNHLRHFYLLSMPDYAKINSVKLASDQMYHDYRIPEDINQNIERHYVESIELSRMAHEGAATLGGKAPHSHGIFVGGITVNIDPYKLEKVRSIIEKLLAFVSTSMKEDANVLATYYPDYFEKGISYPNYMSYGMFNTYDEAEITYVKPSVLIEGVISPLNPDLITEQVKYAWYQTDNPTVADTKKEDAYSFIKSPHYNNLAMEVGPLARLKITGDYKGGSSCLDRNIARVMETEKILRIMVQIVTRIQLLRSNQKKYEIPQNAVGAGLTDTSRGTLGHWVNIENHVIQHYNIITPSVWNLSTKSNEGMAGVIEKALIGTKLNNIDEPVEIGRIARSFDPCVSCATHIITREGTDKTIDILV